jgi:hypothetical protein
VGDLSGIVAVFATAVPSAQTARSIEQDTSWAILAVSLLSSQLRFEEGYSNLRRLHHLPVWVCTLGVSLKHVAALFLCGVGVQVCWAQNYEFGGTIGYGFYRDGTIYAPGAEVQAGIRNRFAAGVQFGQDLYDYVSGEVRYLYQDGHPFLSADGVRTDIQGQSQALTYDLLFHFRDRSHKFRPFLAGGLGAKDYVIAGPAPSPQLVPNIAILTTTDQWKFATTVGGGVKYRIQEHILLRLDFLDYITTFPKQQIMPAPNNTARGIFEQFTPLFGVSYVF